MPVKLVGRVDADDREGRFNVEADLTTVKIDNLLPGWVKPPGRPARASLHAGKQKAGELRFDDLLIDGQGVLVKGTVELDNDGDLQSANFPVFATSDGDKASVRADRGSDGVLRVVMRGDVYDGRNFVKSSMGARDDEEQAETTDLDLDIKLGTVAAINGETMRGLDCACRDATAESQLHDERQDRPRHAADRRFAHARHSGKPGHLSRIERCRRDVAFFRHLFAHGRREHVGRTWTRRPRTRGRRKA